jgi:hypothetical protein
VFQCSKNSKPSHARFTQYNFQQGTELTLEPKTQCSAKKIHVPKILQQELILQQQHKLGIFIGMFKKNYMLSDIYYRGL